MLPKIGNPKLKSPRAVHFTLGLARELDDGWSWGLSGVANAAAESNAPPVSAAARNLYRAALVLDCNLAPDFGAQPAESMKAMDWRPGWGPAAGVQGVIQAQCRGPEAGAYWHSAK